MIGWLILTCAPVFHFIMFILLCEMPSSFAINIVQNPFGREGMKKLSKRMWFSTDMWMMYC